MIDENETVRRFGYRSTDLKHKSGKKILAVCDECGKIRILCKQAYSALCISCSIKGKRNHRFGKHLSEETKKKMTKANKGQVPWNKGGTLSEETKKKIGDAHRGKHLSEEHKKKISKTLKENPPWLGKHFSEETKKKISDARKKQRFPKSRTKPERIFEEICKKHNLPFHYTGDGQLWIGKRRLLNPDFIEANGNKILVEIFGDYWHSPLLRPKMKEIQHPLYREKHYKKYKWQPIFIWESDLKRSDAEHFVLSQLKEVI